MSNDDLGDRMKFYEGMTEHSLMPRIPVIARLDGRSFHTFTKDLDRPFDLGFTKLMRATTLFLAQETNARIGYTQSDEISLIWLAERGSQMFFDSRVLKMTSILSSMASVYFNRELPDYLPEQAVAIKERRVSDPLFDCRVWNVPEPTEAANYLVWRETDATRNSVSMAAQSVYPHNELHKVSHSGKMDLLMAKGINWNDPSYFRRGSYVRRKQTQRVFTKEELTVLPPKHAAHTDPNLVVTRSAFVMDELPIFTRITNREAVIFEGAEAILASAEALIK